MDRGAASEILVNENKDKVLFINEKPMEIFNENHVLEGAGLTKVNYWQLKQMVPKKIIEYLNEKLHLKEEDDLMQELGIEEDQNFSNVNLLCDEEPLTQKEDILCSSIIEN
eukprot:CAMPEP_0202960930 /NCGR_PEP_ID=MMETSP1396-20130829/5059_1 /ASSEMBLY_ACC=CAM_ASM_000872 /TAXON_ID= /ORGANISM="Pseudokeronopsis sp., Strain Brazil" /LENGTH=110 /DNA_ID=CAMNT_0049680459 /DNA_START=798 /DNA_END=1130 /DNA_ORIENTATION=+